MYSRPSRHRGGQAPWYSWGLQILVGAKMPSEWSSWHLTLRWNDKSLWPDTWCWHQPLISLQPVNQWSCSVVSDSAIPWIVAYQAPPSMEFSRQEHWSGCHFLLQTWLCCTSNEQFYPYKRPQDLSFANQNAEMIKPRASHKQTHKSIEQWKIWPNNENITHVFTAQQA